MKAAVYVRISQDHTGEGLGVSRQREDCVELAASLGWEIVETYTDNDTSATSGKPRTHYRRMLADIDAGVIEAVVAWHPDRLYRRAVDLGELVEVCKKHNVQVATVKAGSVDLTTPTGRLVAGLLAQVATYEGEAKADRWRRSIRQRREAGQAPGWGPRLFGYNRDGTVNEDERKVVEWIVTEITEGTSLTRMCHKLNAEGITTTLGNPWRLAALRKLLLNPRLAGFSTMNGDIIGPGTWEPIIDATDWETVRAMVTVKRTTPVRPRVSLLVGLIHCGKSGCGGKMVTAGRAGRGDSPPQRIYRCANTPGHEGCGGVSVDAHAVEEVVEEYARTRLADPRTRAGIERLRAVAGSGDDALELASLEDRITELEAQLDEPGVPVATILRAIDRAKEKRGELLERTARADRTPLPTRGGEWPQDLARRANLVRLVVERVTIEPAKVGGVFDPERVKIKRRD
jgi:DNA invertase Pin-like site-specific DNA recombinase